MISVNIIIFWKTKQSKPSLIVSFLIPLQSITDNVSPSIATIVGATSFLSKILEIGKLSFPVMIL